MKCEKYFLTVKKTESFISLELHTVPVVQVAAFTKMKTALLLALLPTAVLSAVHTATDAQGVYLGNEFRALLPRFSTSRSSLFQDFVLIRLLCAGSHDLTLLGGSSSPHTFLPHPPSPPSISHQSRSGSTRWVRSARRRCQLASTAAKPHRAPRRLKA